VIGEYEYLSRQSGNVYVLFELLVVVVSGIQGFLDEHSLVGITSFLLLIVA
jgi:hypothetical protein